MLVSFIKLLVRKKPRITEIDLDFLTLLSQCQQLATSRVLVKSKNEPLFIQSLKAEVSVTRR
jgi:hypothetical protein